MTGDSEEGRGDGRLAGSRRPEDLWRGKAWLLALCFIALVSPMSCCCPVVGYMGHNDTWPGVGQHKGVQGNTLGFCSKAHKMGFLNRFAVIASRQLHYLHDGQQIPVYPPVCCNIWIEHLPRYYCFRSRVNLLFACWVLVFWLATLWGRGISVCILWC